MDLDQNTKYIVIIVIGIVLGIVSVLLFNYIKEKFSKKTEETKTDTGN